MGLNFRKIGKIGLLLTAIGFFLPAVENVNVFTAMGYLSEFASFFGISLGAFPFFVYLVFISSVVGVVFLILSFAGKPVSIQLEWVTVLTAIASFLIVLFILNRELNDLTRGAGRSVFNDAQFGFYLINIGLIFALIFQIIHLTTITTAKEEEKDVINGRNLTNSTTIETYAFHGKQLTSVTIPDSVATIKDGAFAENQLTSITIPNSVTSIRSGAFMSNQLISVTIPESVTTIDAAAFKKNPLSNITIGANVNLLEARAGEQDFPPFDNDFHVFYNNNGRKAGTYTWDGAAWSFS